MKEKQGYIFIAGASSDIGLSIAKALAEKGDSLILHAASDSGFAKLNQEFGAVTKHQVIQLDFSNTELLVNELSKLFSVKPLLGLVNCVGLRSRRPLKLLKPAHVQSIFQINFFSFLELIRVACTKNKHLSGFSIVQISSISAESGGASVTAYAASKAAGDVAIRSLAKELYSKDIRLNSIRCGQVNTSAYAELQAGRESDPILERQYMGLVEPNDIAELVLFLLSPKAIKLTGQYFNMDGGYLQ